MVKRMEVRQGDILKIDNIREPVFVASKDFFNNTGEVIGCPIFSKGNPGPLHIFIETEKTTGTVHCEKLKLLDLNSRRFSIKDHVLIKDIMNITDTIQGLFDYI